MEVGIVGGQVRGRLGRQLVPRTVAQRHVKGARHLGRDVGLHLEDIGEGRVERLLPLAGRSGAGLDLHEFGAHPDPARASRRLFPLDGGGEQVVGPQLAGDLLGRLGRLAVLVGAGPRDHREPRDLRQLAPHFVGDAVREVRVG